MGTYAIKDFELEKTVNVKAQGVAEAIFDYLPWPKLEARITFRLREGWTVIDNYTDFKYEITKI